MKIFTVFTNLRTAALTSLGLTWLLFFASAITTIIEIRFISSGTFGAMLLLALTIPNVAYIYNRKWCLGGLIVGVALAALILFLPPFTIIKPSTTTQYAPLFGKFIWSSTTTNAALPPGTTDVPLTDMGPSRH